MDTVTGDLQGGGATRLSSDSSFPSHRDLKRGTKMGNSALRAHVETAQKTGVFQLKDRGLTEVRLRGTRLGP